MRFGVVVFPGSNCDHDAWYAVSHDLGHSAEFIWHDSSTLGEVDAVILPGGFSYGDYLRCGAIAKFSPVMKAVREFASRGGLVLGICNGFQVLVESGLLPGALLRNRELKFVCRPVTIRVETVNTPFTCRATVGQTLTLPVAHGEGCYFADDATLAALKRDDRIVFRYVDNPNGSLDDIAGICSEGRNVMGMMPHPERAADALLGSADGRAIFESMIHSFAAYASTQAPGTASGRAPVHA
jgi:phosphoribosylformylglycinamidine synthase